MPKLTMTSKCTSIAAHIEGLVDALVICGVHRPMPHGQGYTRSLWALPSGNYLLSIALAAARVTGNTTTMKKYINFAGQFGGRGSAPVQYHAHRPMEEVQGFF
jgi:hypothetical protein